MVSKIQNYKKKKKKGNMINAENSLYKKGGGGGKRDFTVYTLSTLWTCEYCLFNLKHLRRTHTLLVIFEGYTLYFLGQGDFFVFAGEGVRSCSV